MNFAIFSFFLACSALLSAELSVDAYGVNNIPSRRSLLSKIQKADHTSEKPSQSVTYSLGPNYKAQEMVRFWNEYESVREYPNPAEKIKEREQKQKEAATNKKRSFFKPIVPKSMNQEYFHITRNCQEKDEVVQLPTMQLSSQIPITQFELNTAWIELLIHEQQVKHTSVAAAVP